MQGEAHSNGRDALVLVGGVALMALGAGLLMTRPAVRRGAIDLLNRMLPELPQPLGDSVRGLAPDVERLLKIKAM